MTLEDIPKTALCQYILDSPQITAYVRTGDSALAQSITRVSYDYFELDETEKLVVALGREHVIDDAIGRSPAIDTARRKPASTSRRFPSGSYLRLPLEHSRMTRSCLAGLDAYLKTTLLRCVALAQSSGP
jgi:hypothetical protein